MARDHDDDDDIPSACAKHCDNWYKQICLSLMWIGAFCSGTAFIITGRLYNITDFYILAGGSILLCVVLVAICVYMMCKRDRTNKVRSTTMTDILNDSLPTIARTTAENTFVSANEIKIHDKENNKFDAFDQKIVQSKTDSDTHTSINGDLKLSLVVKNQNNSANNFNDNKRKNNLKIDEKEVEIQDDDFEDMDNTKELKFVIPDNTDVEASNELFNEAFLPTANDWNPDVSMTPLPDKGSVPGAVQYREPPKNMTE